jgi:hypothetical protein
MPDGAELTAHGVCEPPFLVAGDLGGYQNEKRLRGRGQACLRFRTGLQAIACQLAANGSEAGRPRRNTRAIQQAASRNARSVPQATIASSSLHS